MAQAIQFTPKRELTAHKNLERFIAFARDQLILWSDLDGFYWQEYVWPTTHRKIRFTNLEHFDLHPRAYPDQHQLMHPGFADTAKAYLRYRHSLSPTKDIARTMAAMRVIEYALRQDMAIPDITKFEERHWEISVRALEGFKHRQFICGAILRVLGTFSDLYVLIGNQRFWRNPYVGVHGYDAINGTRAPNEVKAKKVPNQDALIAIAEVFSRYNKYQLDADVMITCVTALLMSAPIRFGEILRFRTDCLRSEKDKNGEIQYYLVYWVPKTRQFARKAVPKSMIDITKTAIKRLMEITQEGRLLARYMETNPTKFYRHKNCPNVADDQELTSDQIAKALGFSGKRGCNEFIKRHTGSYAMNGFTLDILWQMVLIEHRSLNPHFPFQEAPQSSTHSPLRMSESLFCFRRFQFATRMCTSAVLLAPFNRGVYGKRLTTGSEKSESMSFFARHGYQKIKVISHSFRHLLNRLGRNSGVSLEMLTEWSSRASTRQTRVYLEDDPASAAVKGANVLGTTQEQEPKAPITDQEAELYSQGPYHRSRYGLCRRSWRAGPCNKFADCLNCSELLMCKGDKLAAESVKQDHDNLVRTYSAAQKAVACGERAASLWTEKAGSQILRLNQLINILGDQSIPDGSPIEIVGRDFNHENVILAEKAEKAGVRLLDKETLGITYGDELLACLELLRSPDNA